ncbi:MAG: acyl-CoA dehydratase activase [Bacillota bacterium]
MTWSIGVDVGSVSAKGVIFNGEEWDYVIIPTGWTPRQAGREVLEQLLKKAGIDITHVGMIVGTGYGRVNLDFAQKTFSEIVCHARGASFLFPQTRGVIDIGGQDSKAIAIDNGGKVKDFILNDKCAAGTGRFLQVMAQVLGYEVAELGERCGTTEPVEIGSMCAVFAESEIIGLLAQGVSQERIVAGVLLSIARRVGTMAAKLNPGPHVTFCGGVAQNQVLLRFLKEHTGWEIEAPARPQLVGALGAAIIGYELCGGGK